MNLASQHSHSKDWSSYFQPSQIICLEYKTTRLYAEVVQIVEIRHLCWARPLVLITRSDSENSPQAIDSKDLYDLRLGADLLLPAILFRQALDVEVVPLLSQLYGLKGELGEQEEVTARQLLNQLIRQIWQAHPDVFSSQQNSSL